ncbi:MAG: hypothetical protein KKA73_12290 [Chloroflexi bacterium]|nr:hypothetical protein [Chloroflexota bacterium]MBU1748461.1 hypothetical protein [Chloroflexota bacterium]
MLLSFVKRHQPYTAQEMTQAEAKASDLVSRVGPTLWPWQPGALADVADHWEGTRGSDSLWIEWHQGTVKSLSHPASPGLLAFYLSLKGGRGFLRLYTYEHEVRLDMAPGLVHVTSRGKPLGSIRPSITTQTISDSTGQPIGRYQRFKGSLVSTNYGPVELCGRTVGEVNILVRRRDALFDHAPRPVIRNLLPDLSAEEEDWLLAVLALELVYNAFRYHRHGSL